MERLSPKQLKRVWDDLGLDLAAHEKLMESMERSHARTFLACDRRPESMGMFDAALHDAHGQRVADLIEHRRKGGGVIGTFCIYVPDEIALAVGIVPVPLCGGSNWPIKHADRVLPRDICPLVRSTMGMAVSETCPYKRAKNYALGETTCDAKKKAWDLFGIDSMELPQRKDSPDRELWLSEIRKFQHGVEELAGRQITEDALRRSIRICNRRRALLREVSELRKKPEPPITGLDALLVSQTALAMSPESFIGAAEALLEELRERIRNGYSAYPEVGPRVIFAGSPAPMGHAKVHAVAESIGLRIVADESCTGARYYRGHIPEDLLTVNGMLDAIADRYFEIDCACFSPNSERVDNVLRMIAEYGADGVVHNVLQYCHGYDIEARRLDGALRDAGIPSILIVSDYSAEDEQRIGIRLEAFRELL
ncbi:2-hydroxyacyl-CoA dehydratase [Candidatus Fermentibacteria bacterium]|nr:2-hydroxyacyl-CoA dehydratase [Candidatus Fermentibacteria bacterium]